MTVWSRSFVSVFAAVVFWGMAAARADIFSVPSGEWVVGRIDAVSPAGKSYCSMRNDYSNGLSVVFARDNDGVNSIAFDFHSKEFSSGSEYPVFLMMDKLSRSRTAVAATDSVLIARMGEDEAFYSALSSKETLKLQSGNKSFLLGLEGTGKGLQKLKDCVSSLTGNRDFSQAGGNLPAAFDGILAAGDTHRINPARAYVNVTKAEAEKSFDIASQAREDVRMSRIDELERKNRILEAKLAEAERREIFNEPPLHPARLLDEVLLSAHLIDKELDGNFFSWNAKGIAGHAREVSLLEKQTTRDVLDGVIASRTSSCKGEFAYTQAVRGDAVFSEMVCMEGKEKGTIEALMIKPDGNKALIISHGGKTDEANRIISARDKMAEYADDQQ